MGDLQPKDLVILPIKLLQLLMLFVTPQEIDAALSSSAEETDAALATQKAAIDMALSSIELKVDAAETTFRSDLEAMEDRVEESVDQVRSRAATAVEELQRALDASDEAIIEQANKDREVRVPDTSGPCNFGWL